MSKISGNKSILLPGKSLMNKTWRLLH